MKVKVTVCLVFLIKLAAFSQNSYECGTLPNNSSGGVKFMSCAESSSDFINHYGKKETYIPLPGSKEDFIKTIHVSFHIWQRADGTGNLDDTPVHRNRLKQVIDWVNDNYSSNAQNLIPLSYPTLTLSDTKFRFVLDSIYFYKDFTSDSMYSYSSYYGHNQVLDDFISANYPERTNSLSLHLIRGKCCGAAGYSDYGSVLSFYRLDNPNTESDEDMNISDGHDYWYSEHLSHEIGHGLDLAHTYEAGEQNCNITKQDFLWDVYDTTAVRPCSNQTSCDVCLIVGGGTNPNNNNILGGNAANFKSALQMGIMHRSVILENQWHGGYNIRDHVTGYNTIPYEITQNETWDFSMKMYQDLVVKSGVILTIKCEIQFVPQARVIIEPGGKLIIDGGKLTNERYYNTIWKGIEVWGNSNHPQGTLTNSPYQGILELKNGAIIENAYIAATNWKTDDWNYTTGGIIYSNGGTFKNNHKDVEFTKYQNFSVSTNNTVTYKNDLSAFRNTDFIRDNDYIGNTDGQLMGQVTMWATQKIT
jgi:hypothetical protein